MFTGKDRSACSTSCEWLQSHLYLHCILWFYLCKWHAMFCLSALWTCRHRITSEKIFSCAFALHLSMQCVPKKMSDHFTPWVHFIVLQLGIIHPSGIHTIHVMCYTECINARHLRIQLCLGILHKQLA